MELSVAVGHCGLLGVAHTGSHGERPDGPVVGHEKFGGVDLPEANRHIDGGKPEVAREAVEYPAYARILFGHAGELSVGAVEGVGPDEQEHANDIDPQRGIVEAYAGSHAEENRGDSDGVWGDTQRLCESRAQA